MAAAQSIAEPSDVTSSLQNSGSRLIPNPQSSKYCHAARYSADSNAA
jgi:hypothetical protein